MLWIDNTILWILTDVCSYENTIAIKKQHFHHVPEILHALLLSSITYTPSPTARGTFRTYNSDLFYFMPWNDFPSLRKLNLHSLPCPFSALCVLNLDILYHMLPITDFLLATLASFCVHKICHFSPQELCGFFCLESSSLNYNDAPCLLLSFGMKTTLSKKSF